MDRIHVAQEWDQWHSLLNMVLNFMLHRMLGTLLVNMCVGA